MVFDNQGMAEVDVGAREEVGYIFAPKGLEMEVDVNFVVAVDGVDFPTIPEFYHNLCLLRQQSRNPTLMTQLIFSLPRLK